MTFLALEVTGSLPITGLVLAAVIALLAHGAQDLRLLLRHLALPPARREHPQRPRRPAGSARSRWGA